MKEVIEEVLQDAYSKAVKGLERAVNSANIDDTAKEREKKKDCFIRKKVLR